MAFGTSFWQDSENTIEKIESIPMGILATPVGIICGGFAGVGSVLNGISSAGIKLTNANGNNDESAKRKKKNLERLNIDKKIKESEIIDNVLDGKQGSTIQYMLDLMDEKYQSIENCVK